MAALKHPTFKRQQFLLLMLHAAGGRLARTDLQKLLFLFNQEMEEPYYDFVPYRFGCYSFQAAEDLEILDRLGWIDLTSRNVELRQASKMSLRLPGSEIISTTERMKGMKSVRGKRLVRRVYEAYPYYAINSEIARDILGDSEYQTVAKSRRALRKQQRVLFTIGYEGIKFETYLNKLIQNDVRLLCDVRRNPLSRKFGFSKRTLETVLPKLGIEYRHIPELGIVSEKRRTLSSDKEFEALFDEYRQGLPKRQTGLTALRRLLDEKKRVAITCFEEHHTSCHRHCISDYLNARDKVKVTHL